jgi:hypothetical protein
MPSCARNGFLKIREGGAGLAVINESMAWEILHSYALECAALNDGSLLAIYATGSLGGGYYRAGQSDIDAVLIVRDAPNSFLPAGLEPSEELTRLNRMYRGRYAIPKDFAPFPLPVRKLFPPYDPAEELAPEIARLKLQGLCVWGSFDLNLIPMPTSEDARRCAEHFETWWRDEFSKTRPISTLNEAECVNTILIHLGRFFWIKRGVIVFNKLKLVQTYLAHDPPFTDPLAFEIVGRYLVSGTASKAETVRLRQCLTRLRSVINANLGIPISGC